MKTKKKETEEEGGARSSFESLDPETVLGDFLVEFASANKLEEGEFVELDALALLVLEESVTHIRPQHLDGLSNALDRELRRRDHAVLDDSLVIRDSDDTLGAFSSQRNETNKKVNNNNKKKDEKKKNKQEVSMSILGEMLRVRRYSARPSTATRVATKSRKVALLRRMVEARVLKVMDLMTVPVEI